MPGKTTAPALWCPSVEQIVQTVHSHLLFFPWYIVCALAFHSARKVALWAYKQTVQKRASQPLPFPGELAFLFRLQAVKDLESWCQCPELIALSWSKLHRLPNVQKMFINNTSSRILASICPLVVAFIRLPPSHPWPLGIWGWGVVGVAGGGGSCPARFFQSLWQNLELPWCKNFHLCNETHMMNIFVRAQEGSRVIETASVTLEMSWGTESSKDIALWKLI